MLQGGKMKEIVIFWRIILEELWEKLIKGLNNLNKKIIGEDIQEVYRGLVD